MPRACSICIHPQILAIDAALAAGGVLRNIRQRCGTSTTTLHRHKHAHLVGCEDFSQEPQPPEAVLQEPSTLALAPRVQEFLDEYKQVNAILDALRTLTERTGSTGRVDRRNSTMSCCRSWDGRRNCNSSCAPGGMTVPLESFMERYVPSGRRGNYWPNKLRLGPTIRSS